MIKDYAYAYSNYRSYARPADDGLSVWHPAYLRLAPTLDHCARRYAQFFPALSIGAEAAVVAAMGRLAPVAGD
jgi:hypothetical protein